MPHPGVELNDRLGAAHGQSAERVAEIMEADLAQADALLYG
jgi:hypothetical protein